MALKNQQAWIIYSAMMSILQGMNLITSAPQKERSPIFQWHKLSIRFLKSEVAKNSLIRVFGEDVADFSEVEKYEKDLKEKVAFSKFHMGFKSLVLMDKFLTRH